MRINPLLVILFVTCLNRWAFAQRDEKPIVILISFDGFRSDYIHKYDLQNFRNLASAGVQAEGLIPCFPSKTFPNHYSMATGLYPGNHGLVDNYFYDPKSKSHYGISKREAITNAYYYGGVPLWQLCKQNGLIAASYFWVGSEMKEEHLHPDYYYEYEKSTPFDKRSEQVINWLKLPAEKRPRLICLYFSSPDDESHDFGPWADQTKATLEKLDAMMGKLLKDVAATKLPVNVVVVSDHGMSELKHYEKTYIFVDELIGLNRNWVMVNGGTQAHIYAEKKTTSDSLYLILKSREDRFKVYKRQDFPERWNYVHERAGDLLLVADPGYYLKSGTRETVMEERCEGCSFGAHGYDPGTVQEMEGIFYAIGPDIKPGMTIQRFENIHIYPFIAQLLGLEIPQVDGRLEVLKPIIKN